MTKRPFHELASLIARNFVAGMSFTAFVLGYALLILVVVL